MPRPNPDIIHRQAADAADAQKRIDRDIEPIIRKGRHKARDGYPSSSMGGDGSGTEINRPTEATAIARPIHDPTGDDIRELMTVLKEIYDLSLRGDVLRGRIMGPEESKGLRLNQTPVCVNRHCVKPLTTEGRDGRGEQGRCNNCYKYRLSHDGEDRPIELIEQEKARNGERWVS